MNSGPYKINEIQTKDRFAIQRTEINLLIEVFQHLFLCCCRIDF